MALTEDGRQCSMCLVSVSSLIPRPDLYVIYVPTYCSRFSFSPVVTFCLLDSVKRINLYLFTCSYQIPLLSLGSLCSMLASSYWLLLPCYLPPLQEQWVSYGFSPGYFWPTAPLPPTQGSPEKRKSTLSLPLQNLLKNRYILFVLSTVSHEDYTSI